jgi:hypothetical protein
MRAGLSDTSQERILSAKYCGKYLGSYFINFRYMPLNSALKCVVCTSRFRPILINGMPRLGGEHHINSLFYAAILTIKKVNNSYYQKYL